MNYYPVFLNLMGKKVVVIGGGKVAERKITTLISAGAKITVVSPALTRRLRREKERKTITHIPRSFEKKDLDGAFVVIAATDSPETNKDIAANSPSLVNVVDVPSLCNFIAPSILKRGDLIIAISTGGASPSVAKAIRQELETSYGPEFSRYLKFVKSIRLKALSLVPEKKTRELFLKYLGSQKVLRTLRSTGFSEARKQVLIRFDKIARKQDS